jgi:DNA-binding response OmpR family regulator
MLRLLIAEDDGPLREALREALEVNGFVVETAATAQAACHSAAAVPFDLVVSDVRLSGGSGLDVLACVRRHSPDTPVILMSGFDVPEGRDRAFAAGASDYLVKPIALKRLLGAIATATRR